MWLAQHLLVAQQMLGLIEREWNGRYQAKYRLINLEQLLGLAGKLFYPKEDPAWIAPYLEGSRDRRAASSDWTLEGLCAFAAFMRTKRTTLLGIPQPTQMVAEWAEGDDNFSSCNLLIHGRALLRYMEQHKHTVATTAKMVAMPLPDGSPGIMVLA